MKQIITTLKIQIPGAMATPAPPVGTALGPHGVNLQEFVTRFNEMTKDMRGDVIPVEVTIYADRSMDLKLKTPPAAEFLKKAAGVTSGSKTPNTVKVGKVTKAQVRDIAEKKMVDVSARDIDAAVKIIEGTARSMGITVE
ncbi:MAG TPA: 50S ribosomal protein L11 [Candidatus Andersenbacteria bacterium]|nr:50S ribosomal protein L11 [Candidatus Andersenbacteria bacterium]